MIYDKIKIYVTKTIAALLERDADNFEFHKSDGVSINKNAFLTALIINYQDDFTTRQQNLYSKIEDVLNATRLTQSEVSTITTLICEGVNREITASPTEKFDGLISYKPTKESTPIIDYAENYLLNGSSLSEFYRNMFTSYASLPQDKREEIIFRNVVTKLNQAINEGKKVFISTINNTSKPQELEPYAISRSKEELHVYLLAKSGNFRIPIRISRIQSVTILNSNSYFTNEDELFFNKMQAYGPQFSYSKNDPVIKVKLSKVGVKKYQRFYVHRPIPSNIEGDVYTFNCSQDQVIQYFSKFGSDAFILSPVDTREKVMRFYSKALKYYNDKIIEEGLTEVAVTKYNDKKLRKDKK